MRERRPVTGKGRRGRLGKDHLNLADWRVSVPTFQQPRSKDGGTVDFVEYVIARADSTDQRVTLESPSRIGLPTAGDEDVIVALLYLAKEQEFASDVVHFVPAQLLEIMGWPRNRYGYQRLKAALKRLKAVTVTYELTWYSRKKNSVEPVLITGILAEAKLVLRRGRPAADALPDSYVQWTKNFFASLQDGNLTNLDLDLYFSWSRPGTRQLYRHLNKVWHAGKKPRAYERDLAQLACGHLGMTAGKDLKRNFHQLVKEMEGGGYLRPMDTAVRYRKVRPGVWRVRLELDPDHCRQTEPKGEEVADRFFAGMLKVDTWRLKKGNLTEAEYQRMGGVFDQVAKERIFIDDDPDTTLQNLRSKARRQQIEHGLDLLIVDYLQLVEVTDRAAGENQTQRITFISKSLKNLARELGCPVIALSQLSRSCEQRSPPIPILSDLRDSGAIEQDADSVLMLYRQGYYDEDCEQPQLTDLYLRKNRHGPTGHVELSFQPESTCFQSVDRR